MQFQIVDIPFGQGLNEKIDRTLLPNGLLVGAQEALFDKHGAVNKRGAFKTYPSAIYGGTSLGDAKRLATHQGELLLADGHNLRSLDETTNKWTTPTPASELPEPACAVETICQDPTGAANWAVVTENQGIRAVAFADNSGNVALRVFDAVTGAPLQTFSTFAGNFPQLVNLGSSIWLVYTNGTNVKGVRVDVSAPNVVAAGPVNVATDFNAAGYIDATPLDSSHFVLAYYGTTGGNNVTVALVDNTGAVSSSNKVIEAPTNSIGVVATSGEAIYVTWHQGTNGQRAWALNPATLVQLFVPVTVNGTLTPVSGLSSVCRLSATSAMLVWREEKTSTLRSFLRMVSITNAGVLGQLQSTPSVGIVSKPFVATDGHMYVLAQNSDLVGKVSAQPTYFLLDLQINDLAVATKLARVVAALKSDSGVTRNAGTLPLPAATSTAGQYVIVSAGRSRNNLGSGHGDLVYQFTFDFAPANDRRWLPAEFGKATVFTGGVATAYDGVQTYELGFFLAPEFGAATANTTGTMATGTYAVAFIYEWRDARGQRVLSAPQEVSGIAVTGPSGSIDVTIPMLSLTSKMDRHGVIDTNAVRISIYVTDSNGDVFFFNKSAQNNPASNTATATLTAVDTTAEELYTTGEVLEDSMPPASSAVAVHDNRLWLVMVDDPKTIRYSKEVTVGISPEFNEGLAVRIDAGGNITALASMDDKLIAFKASTIFAITGQGAEDTGVNSTLQVSPVLSEAGCTEPRSIAVTPNGILFRGAKGMYLLDRSLQLTYVGAAAEDTLAGLPGTTSATLLEDARRVVFTCAATGGATGKMLVYDTLAQAWATWNPNVKTTHGGGTNVTGLPWASACVHAGRYVIAGQRATAALTNGPCYYYDGTTFKDDALYQIQLRITTGPLRMASSSTQSAGPQLWQRVRRVILLTTWKSDYGLTVDQYLNYPVLGTTPQSAVFDSTATAASASTGQVGFRPKAQKCEAMALDIYDGPAKDASFGEGFSISGIALEIGVDNVTYRLPTQARAM